VSDGARPLSGRRIVVTRTRLQAAGLVDRLHALGASVVVVPLITTVPVATPDAIAATAAEVSSAAPPRWVAFTSATAVRLVIGAAGIDALALMKVAAVGAATAAALREAGAAPDLVATEQDAAGLGEALVARGVAGGSVWFPSAEGASGRLAETVRAAGARLILQVVYRTVMPQAASERLRAALHSGVDAITLTSGSTARNLVRALDGAALPASVVIVCIGGQTAADARSAGLRVQAIAPDASAEGLAIALTECLTPQPLR
jgi:uroporphyrinogen III methyltransferase/synthase